MKREWSAGTTREWKARIKIGQREIVRMGSRGRG